MPRILTGREAHPGTQGGERIIATDEDLDNITKWAAAGLTQRSIARRLGISASLFGTWMGYSKATADKADSRVQAAWELGMAEIEERLDLSMMQVATDPSHRAFPNMNIWAQKVKLNRSEKRITEVEMTDETKQKVGSLFNPTIEIVETHRDPKTGETLREPTITKVNEGQ